MNEVYGASEAKSGFSELLNRAANGYERFVICKRGKPFAAIGSTENLTKLMEDTHGVV